MANKRHNIDTIAEVLIDKLNDLERTAEKIDQASKRTMKLDVSELRLLQKERNISEKSILNDLKQLQSKNQTRLPNWVLGVLFAFFLGLIGSIYFAYSSIKKVKYLEKEKDYYYQEMTKLQKIQQK